MDLIKIKYFKINSYERIPFAQSCNYNLKFEFVMSILICSLSCEFIARSFILNANTSTHSTLSLSQIRMQVKTNLINIREVSHCYKLNTPKEFS